MRDASGTGRRIVIGTAVAALTAGSFAVTGVASADHVAQIGPDPEAGLAAGECYVGQETFAIPERSDDENVAWWTIPLTTMDIRNDEVEGERTLRYSCSFTDVPMFQKAYDPAGPEDQPGTNPWLTEDYTVPPGGFSAYVSCWDRFNPGMVEGSGSIQVNDDGTALLECDMRDSYERWDDENPPPPPPPDRDCADFATHEEAQTFFIDEGGPELDPHRLDADGDGIACEELIEEPPPQPPAPQPPALPGVDRDCADFATHEEAQTFFIDEGGPELDPHRLDADGDGVACEELIEEPAPQPPAPQPPAPQPPTAPGARPQARLVDDSCPVGTVTEDGFSDVPSSSPFEAYVDCVAFWGVANGTSATTYAPLASVTRGQMAAFISRLITRSGGSLPAAPADAFTDDETSTFETQINQLAAAGIVNGTGAGRYEPRALVTRGQMAAFLVRAHLYRTGENVTGSGDYFPDDVGYGLESAINAAAELGFTGGYTDGTYRPLLPVRRDEMAAFLSRLLDVLVEDGYTEVPGAQ